MATRRRDEALIRDFLATKIERLPKLVKNLSSVKAELKAQESKFQNLSADQGGPTAADLVERILAKRNLRGLDSFHSLELIGVEFELLKTGKPGFQPSTDILARCSSDNRFFLIEIKQLVETERQAVTELSAYSQGLHKRFWNLGPSDCVWMPVSTEWHTTVREAFANEAIWQRRAVLPMQLSVTKGTRGNVTAVKLELLSLLDAVDEPTSFSQFAWSCFDTIAFALSKQPSDPRTLVEFISAIAARLGFSGCVLYGESLAAKVFPYPYVYALAVHNPFKAALKARQLAIVLADKQRGGRNEMCKQVKQDSWEWHDIDFVSGNDQETPYILREIASQAAEAGRHSDAQELLAEAEERYLSVQDMASASSSRTHSLFQEITACLESFCDFTAGAPSLKGLFHESPPIIFDHVSYFGLMQEAAYERLQWEISRSSGGAGSAARADRRHATSVVKAIGAAAGPAGGAGRRIPQSGDAEIRVG